MDNRYLTPLIQDDLKNKMVFLAGPRQVGKTTLAKHLGDQSGPSLYLSWDKKEDRKKIRNSQWPDTPLLIILDELHKYSKWKRYIKGEYDHFKNLHQFLVTGSARMDVYRRGGDSLQGRYHHYRLHPFSLSELEQSTPTLKPFYKLDINKPLSQKKIVDLFNLSGFPEPYFGKTPRTHRRWQKERLDRFFREDVRDLENIRDLSSLQILTEMLPEKTGNPLSLNNLREDLEVSHRAITHWIDILERLYFLFKVPPFHLKKTATFKKMSKTYLWDWSLVSNEGMRFENMIASHLLKTCHFLEDAHGYKTCINFMRDTDKREVDFVITENGKPWFAVEVKLSDTTPSKHLAYYGEKLKIPFLYQVVFQENINFVAKNIHVLSANQFLSGLI